MKFSYAIVCMQLLESMLTKLVEEFENRLNSQNELVCLVPFVHFLHVVFEILLNTAMWQSVEHPIDNIIIKVLIHLDRSKQL